MIRKLLIIVCLLSTVFIAFAGKNKKKKKDKEEKNHVAPDINYRILGQPMPPINFLMKNGKLLTGDELKNDANLFVILFNPTCEHCQEQAIQLERNLDLIKKSHVLFIAASGMKEYLQYFESVTKLSKYYPKLQMGIDSCNYVNNTFTYQNLPQINIYDKERKLLRTFVGETSMDTLKKYIE